MGDSADAGVASMVLTTRTFAFGALPGEVGFFAVMEQVSEASRV
jgi:hypothetical protein